MMHLKENTENRKVIRDPVHGYIEVDMEERKFIELPVFQRLRRISQLSFGDLVYPSANHNRFSHSLGVMYLAKIVADYLRTSGMNQKIGLSSDECDLIIWAALLHDVGHLPFSHACEPAFAYYINNSNNWKDYHVDLGCRIIKNPDFGIVDIIGKETAEKVCQLIKGEDDNLSRHLVEIMTGTCSIDRLDYLKRDAYHAGTSEYAIIDAERILKSLTVYPDDPDMAPVFKKKALYALEGVVLSYFYMYRAIYYHHAVRAAYLLFQEIIWNAFENYDLKRELGNMLSPDFWCHFDDHYFLTVLRELHKDIRIQIEKIVFRRLPKLIPLQKMWRHNIYKIYRFLEKASFKEKIEKEREIAEKLRGFKVEKIFLDSPMVIPYPRSLLAEGGIYIWEENSSEPQNIAEYAPYILRLSDAAEAQLAARVYVLPSELRFNEDFIREINEIIREVLK